MKDTRWIKVLFVLVVLIGLAAAGYFVYSGFVEYWSIRAVFNSATQKIVSITGLNIWLARALACGIVALLPLGVLALKPVFFSGARVRRQHARWTILACGAGFFVLFYFLTKDNVMGKYFVYDPISNHIELSDAGGIDPRTNQERRPIDSPQLAMEVRLFIARTEGKLASSQIYFDQTGEALYRYYRAPDGRIEIYPRFLAYHPRYGQQMPLLNDADVVRQYETQLSTAKTAARSGQGRPINPTQKKRPVSGTARPAVAREATAAARGGPESDNPGPSLPAVPAPPTPIVKTLAPGTPLHVVLLRALSSKTNRPGDMFTGRFDHDILVDGVTVIPASSEITGSVTEAVPQPKIGGAASLALQFTRIKLPGGAVVPIRASWAQKGKSKSGKDAAKIGGSAGAGAFLGSLLSKSDKTKGSAIGALVGGAGGTAIAAGTGRQEVEISAGATINVALEELAQVTITTD